ncbi:MAG: hypothetical protein Q9M82_05405 [Mariprofundus sp.]|nr:hypothetical protein [Mariprofundus sp.]
MRILVWVAVLSLQMGIFVCGAGIDVCQAADTTSHIASSQTDNNHDNSTVDQTCAAHAAHVFLGQAINNHGISAMPLEQVNIPASLNLPEIAHFIDQPPKLLHS